VSYITASWFEMGHKKLKGVRGRIWFVWLSPFEKSFFWVWKHENIDTICSCIALKKWFSL